MRLLPITSYLESRVCDDLKREIDLYDSFFSDFMSDRSVSTAMPKVDMSLNKKDVIVKAELPGMDVKDIDLTVKNGYLTIAGERKNESETEEMNYFCRETSYGYFKRTVELPEDVDEEKVKADYKDGILTVTLPKANGKDKKAIKIQAH